MSWDKIWAINKQRIDPIVPRYCAMEKKGLVKLTLKEFGRGMIRLEALIELKFLNSSQFKLMEVSSY